MDPFYRNMAQNSHWIFEYYKIILSDYFFFTLVLLVANSVT